MLPRGDTLAEQNIYLQAISSRQKKAENLVCQTVKRDAVKDTTNPLKFSLLRAIRELIDRPKRVTAKVGIVEKFDPELQKGSNVQKTFSLNLLPAKYTKRSTDEKNSGTIGFIPLKSHGGGQMENDINKSTQILLPAKWQSL